MASRLLVSRLNRVDLPTFGRPTRAITGTMRLSTAIFQKTRRPLQAAAEYSIVPRARVTGPEKRLGRSVLPADGQCNQLAIVAEGIQPVTLNDRTSAHAGTVDAGTGYETAINLAEQMQVAFHIAHCDVAGEHARPGKLTPCQCI